MPKGFIKVAGRHLHYVRLGSGPALVMLHASPCSAKVMAPLQAIFAPRFTTFAFDLPGFGYSDPLDRTPLETADLADAIASGVRALGLSHVALYGRHTGAGVAVELAHWHPDLVSMVLTDGFPVFAQPYTAERLAEYLRPITPQWDGGHLTWTWFRYREQHLFWPWDKALPQHRADTEIPPIDFLYRGALEMLESGDNYPTVYASAFRHPGLTMIDQVRPPVCFGNRPGDSQFKTMRLYPPGAWVQQFARDPLEAAAQELQILSRHPARGAVPPREPRIGRGVPDVMDYVDTPAGQCFVLGAGLDRPGDALLLLPDLPGSVILHAGLVAALGRHRPVVAIDPRGNGRSPIAADDPVGVEHWADDAAAALDAFGLERAAIVAIGTSAAIAVALGRRGRASALVLQSPPAGTPVGWADDYAPDLTPRRDGGNFLALWHHLRDQELWFPWFEQDPAHARATPRIAPEVLHRRAVICLAHPHHYRPTWRALLSHQLDEQLVGLAVPVRVCSRNEDVFAGGRLRAASLTGGADPVLLPDSDADAAGVVLALLNTGTDAASALRAPPSQAEGRAHAAA